MKTFNWEEFKNTNNKIAVYCEKEGESVDFCNQMAEHDLKWKSGDSLLDLSAFSHKKDVCFSSEVIRGKLDYYKSHNYTILNWSDYAICKEWHENIFKVEIPVNVRFKFNRQKFAEYMCADIDKNSEEYKEAYEVHYNYPNEHGFTKEDVKYMLENNILVRLDEDEIEAEHIDEYLYEEQE